MAGKYIYDEYERLYVPTWFLEVLVLEDLSIIFIYLHVMFICCVAPVKQILFSLKLSKSIAFVTRYYFTTYSVFE